MRIILIFVLMLFTVFLRGQHFTPLDSVTIRLIAQHCNTLTYDTFQDGRFRQCRLDQSVTIHGILCKDWIKLHENGRIKQFQPVTGIVLGNIKIPGGSTVFLDSSGYLKECWFSEDTRIGNIVIKGGLVKIPTQFHTNGQISCCFLAENQVISNIPCMSGMLSPVCFYPNGKLKSCTLSENTTFGKEKYVKGTKLQFGLDGKIIVLKE